METIYVLNNNYRNAHKNVKKNALKLKIMNCILKYIISYNNFTPETFSQPFLRTVATSLCKINTYHRFKVRPD